MTPVFDAALSVARKQQNYPRNRYLSRIMTVLFYRSTPADLSFHKCGRRFSAAFIAFGALVAPVIIGMAAPAASRGQSTDEPLRFEVASVKPCKEEPATDGQRRREYTYSPGRVTIQCLTLERIIFFAYAGVGNLSNPLLNVSPGDSNQVRGGAGWIRSDRFTIEATSPEGVKRTVMMGPMLRALLQERFQLKTHRETEEVALYALTVAKSGLKVTPLGEDGCISAETATSLAPEARIALNNGSKPVCGSFQSIGDGVNRRWSLGATSLAKFASQTLSSVLDRYVLDMTEAPGLFNIRLEFGLDESIRADVFGGGRAMVSPPPDISKGPSIFTALEQQLGLKIEKTRGRREFLVIDRVERPSGN